MHCLPRHSLNTRIAPAIKMRPLQRLATRRTLRTFLVDQSLILCFGAAWGASAAGAAVATASAILSGEVEEASSWTWPANETTNRGDRLPSRPGSGGIKKIGGGSQTTTSAFQVIQSPPPIQYSTVLVWSWCVV